MSIQVSVCILCELTWCGGSTSGLYETLDPSNQNDFENMDFRRIFQVQNEKLYVFFGHRNQVHFRC
jgi:hypothetical protein